MAGAYDLKDKEEVKQYLEDLGIEYRFSCYSEKRPDGCQLLADYLEAVKQEFNKAASVLLLNCNEYNYGKSCYKYASYRLLGKAFKRKRCSARDCPYMMSAGCHKNEELAQKYFVKGCQLNFPKSCLLAGVNSISTGKSQQEQLQGIKYLEKGCNGKDAESCYMLSGLYIRGSEHVPKNMQKASVFAEKACELNNPFACANLSQMYSKGDGVEQNDALAKKFRLIAMDIQDQHQGNFQLKFGE